MVGAKLKLVIQLPKEMLFFFDLIRMFVVDDELAIGNQIIGNR
jgi:hypothetical protein